MRNLPKLFLSFLLLSFSLTLVSQVSINSSHMPQAGDTLRFSISPIDSAVLATYADTGANRVWNFDSLAPLRQGLSEFFNSSETPYPIFGKVAEKLADTLAIQAVSLYDVYNFYTNSSSSYEINQRGARIPLGPINLPITPTYSDPDEVYEFPLNYLDKDSNTFNFTFTNIFPPAYYSSSGYRVNTVEAWGTISTPFGTFNCLKVRTDIVSYDTVSFNNLNFGDSTFQREYKWISPQLRIPAMILSGNLIGDLFVPINMQYRDSARKEVPGLFAPVAIFTADSTEIRVGDTLQFNNTSVSVFPASYNWQISPASFAFINGTGSTTMEPQVAFADTGFYDVQLIVRNSRGADTLLREDYIYVSRAVSLLEHDQDLSDLFEIFPNPIEENRSITLRSKESFNRIRLFDVHLRLVQEWTPNRTNEMKLDLRDDLKGSTYFLYINTEKGIALKKILIY